MAAFHKYDQNAAAFVAQYESLSFEQVHGCLVDLLPEPGATVLDVGAGSGRDAAWFAARGYEVVAVEPSGSMRSEAMRLHPAANIRWLDDSLPDLSRVRRLGLTYDLIVLSAVWMHVPEHLRERCLRKLTTLLAPNGRIAISLRLGEADPARDIHVVSLAEMHALARQFGLRVIRTEDSTDQLGRAAVSWTTVVLGLPDDGIGTLPLLRHLILRDEKSSTYKIALLRILARIADVAGGTARHESESVVLPLGLVALFWLRIYKPLVEQGLPQMPVSRTGSGLGFVRDSFHALRSINAAELRVGATFSGANALNLHKTLIDIAQLIRTMPAGHLFWPSSDKPIFDVRPRRRVTTPDRLVVDDSFLWSLGEFHLPAEIWQALCHHNVWIEPVLVAEWVRLIVGYAGPNAPSIRDKANALLAWADPERDTRLARETVERIRLAGKTVYCVWTGNRLRDQFEIDHCFPFSAWPCDDMWNLMPTGKKVNLEKSNRLVTMEMLERSAEHIVGWWTEAYITPSTESKMRFFSEAKQTLPIYSEALDVTEVIDAMKLHRIRLNRDQGLRAWPQIPYV